jgi:superfamily I DNA/RNA helicase
MQLQKIKITKNQEKCITFQPEGDLLVRGIPGSGKTTVLLERARFLQIKNSGTVLFLAYNKALTTYIRQLSLKSGDTPVEASTFHQWGIRLLKEIGVKNARLIGVDQKKVMYFAYNTIKKYSPDAKFPQLSDEDRQLIKFLIAEISWIKGNGIMSRQHYMDILRSGRGNQVKVSKEHRNTIYDVLEKYNEMLSSRKYSSIDFDDVALLIIQHADKIPDVDKPDNILVDEAQDLTSMQLKAISKLAKKSLTIGADKGQQIYHRNFSWKDIGIDVTKGRSKFLNETFRSTQEIIRLAIDFQKYDKSLLKDENYTETVLPNASGQIPVLVESDRLEKEVETVVTLVKRYRSNFPEDTVGVIGQSRKRLEKFSEALEDAGIPWIMVKEDETDILAPGVKLVTYYSAKGLEFDHVIVTNLKRGYLPYKRPTPGIDEEDHIAAERRKFFVAMTRAKYTLTISAVQPFSSFVEELNPNLYKKVILN